MPQEPIPGKQPDLGFRLHRLDTTPIAIKRNPWKPEEVLHDVSQLKLPEDYDYETVKSILHHDMISEYDARLFSKYVDSLGIPLSEEFRPVEELWNIDEDNHYQGFRMVNQALLGLTDEDVKEVHAREANFEPLADLLRDEFSILTVVAYDEIATVHGYKADLPMYDQFGTQFSDFIRRVISDEGWHYNKFTRLIKRYHKHRIGEAEELVAKIRASEGLPYQATFVMDHVEDVFTPGVLDKSADILLRHLHSTQQQEE